MHKLSSKTARAFGLMALLSLGGCDDHKPPKDTPTQTTTAAMAPAQQAAPAAQAQAAHLAHHHLARPAGAKSAADDSDNDNDQNLQSQFDHLPQGAIVYNPPSQMTLDSTGTITVRIYGNSLPHPNAPAMAGSGTPVTENTKVSTLMTVSLMGGNFTINPATGAKQLVPTDGFAEWTFQVKPTAGGSQDLILQAMVFVGDNQTGLPSITRPITVKVTAFQFLGIDLSNFWNWLWGALGAGVVAAVTYFIKRWWNGKQAKPSDDS